VYVPFDSETIDVRQPWTLLATAADQLASQILPAGADDAPAEIVSAFGAFRLALGRFRDNRASVITRASGDASQAARGRRALAAEDSLSAGFGDLLNVVASFAAANQQTRDVPVVVILDTFEEVLYRTDEDLLGLWRMLGAVQQSFDALRVLISGRAEPRPFKIGRRRPDSFVLGDLAEPDALLMLERLGVLDPTARAAIVRSPDAQTGCSRCTRRGARVKRVWRP
jgi:hypothetical protein